MGLNERFAVGRVRRRLLRAPVIDGWVADELGHNDARRDKVALDKRDGGLALSVPGEHDVILLGADASAAVGEDGAELLVAWPERIVIVRRDGVVVYADGDVVHFGELALDPTHAIERTGYAYLTATGAEVSVELTATANGERTVTMLGPGASVAVGPYTIEHQQSFDPSDRPSGARHHGYAFRVRRSGGTPVARDARAPHPLDIDSPGPVTTLARDRGLLGDDEALAAEPQVLSSLLSRYEGPRNNVEETLREAGPPPSVRHHGDGVVVDSAYLARGDRGEPHLGRLSLTLSPAGTLRVDRADLRSLPGRLRKRPQTG